MTPRARAVLQLLASVGAMPTIKIGEAVPGAGPSLLRGLEDEGLLRSWDGNPHEVPARLGRPRRYYAITPEGRTALAGAGS